MVDDVPITLPRKRRGPLEMRAAREAEYQARKAREEAEHIAWMDSTGSRNGVCYFLACEEGLVKIGYSRDLWQRVSQIRPTCMYKLTVLAVAPGGRSRESHYHHKFREHREFGEWFTRAPEIEEEMARLAATEFSQDILIHSPLVTHSRARAQRQEQAA
jgi:hypothetical protein